MKHLAIGVHLERDDAGADGALILPVGSLFISAMALEPDQPVADRDLILRAADLRRRLLDRQTFIAIRYGLVVSSAEDAAARTGAHLERWRSLLTAWRDHVEFTLKVVVADQSPRPDRHDFSSGADYLRALHRARSTARVDPEFRKEADTRLGAVAARTLWISRGDGGAELVALVPRARIDAVREIGGKMEQELSVPFLLSGPWPLEAFADEER